MKRSLDGGRLGGTGWPRGGRALIAGRGYDPDKPRASSGDGVEATISRSQTDSGSSGLGTVRWVSSPVHLAAFVRELRLRWERLAASTEPFMSLGFAVVCWRCPGVVGQLLSVPDESQVGSRIVSVCDKVAVEGAGDRRAKAQASGALRSAARLCLSRALEMRAPVSRPHPSLMPASR